VIAACAGAASQRAANMQIRTRRLIPIPGRAGYRGLAAAATAVSFAAWRHART
jgi:hypothetical protein